MNNWFTIANAFTFLRALLVPVIGVFVYYAVNDTTDGDIWSWIASAVFVFAALTDAIDGWVARKTNTVTPMGALWDPIADKMLVIGVLIILAMFGQIWWWVVFVIAIREIGMTLWRMAVIRNGGGVVSARNLGKLKTTTQLVGITMVLLPIIPLWWGQIVILISVALTLISAADLLIKAYGGSK